GLTEERDANRDCLPTPAIAPVPERCTTIVWSSPARQPPARRRCSFSVGLCLQLSVSPDCPSPMAYPWGCRCMASRIEASTVDCCHAPPQWQSAARARQQTRKNCVCPLQAALTFPRCHCSEPSCAL